jgi:hypothetical protein
LGEPDYAVIAGVNKTGTTSLFVSLSTHPAIAPSAMKETRYFLPARYGQPLDAPSEWEHYFTNARAGQLRLEDTPSYFYGGAEVATAIADHLTNVKVIVLFREPVGRAVSFFTYQKVRLRPSGARRRSGPRRTRAKPMPRDVHVATLMRVAARVYRSTSPMRLVSPRGGAFARAYGKLGARAFGVARAACWRPGGRPSVPRSSARARGSTSTPRRMDPPRE